MDRRTLLAISLCFGIFLAWQKLYLEPLSRASKQTPQQATSASTETTNANPLSPTQITLPTKTQEAPSRPLQTTTGEALLSSGSSVFTNWSLSKYQLGLEKDAPPVDLYSVTHENREVELAFDAPSLSYFTQVQGKLNTSSNGSAWDYEDSNIKVSREVTSEPGQPYLNFKLTVKFKTPPPRYAFISLTSQGAEKDPAAQDRQLLYWSNKSIERVLLKSPGDLKQVLTPVKFIGAADRYFLMALVTPQDTAVQGLVQPLDAHSARLSLVYPISGDTLVIPLKIYFGPKELSTLRAVDPSLDNTVDFGWFTLFAYPLLALLKWLYTFVGNYGAAIVILTLILKIATYPLTYKSVKSMKQMAKLQPQIQALREKYKDDKEALNREMMTMLRGRGYNPLAGCLPLLVTMPVFFALYRVLYSSIELYHAPFALWIHDLAAHDPFYVTPGLLAIMMFVQQKLTPNTATDPAQQKMMQLMPLMFGFFMLWLPSGLTLYMLTNSVASIVQQVILNRKFDVGHAPAAASAR